MLERVRSTGPATAADLTPYALTEREVEVLALVGAGLTNTEIGGRLHLSMSSVKTHVSNVLRQDRTAGTGCRPRSSRSAPASTP